MKDKVIQWHPGFVAAMNLEFSENRKELIFEKEYNLNTKPLEIDLLVIKKDASVKIVNEIGAFFKSYNIMEYKSPKDHLDIDSFYKANAYASLYKSYGKTVDAVKAEDITVTLIRKTKPKGLFQYFKEHEYKVSNPHKGIYYIESPVLFSTQILVTQELDKAEHIWLASLSETLQKQDMQGLIENISHLTNKEERELADSVLQVSIEANQQIVNEMMGDDGMCEALMEILEPKITTIRLEGMQEGRREGMKEGRREGIQGTVDTLKEFGHADTEIKSAIMRKYSLAEEEAEEYFKSKPI